MTPPDTRPPRWIEYQRLDSIQPHPDNPKDHALEDLDTAMRRFDYTEPMMVDERTGYLVSGHGRHQVLVLRQQRGEHPPGGVVVEEGGVWTVPVVRGWASDNDDEASAYRIGANRLTEAGGWVLDVLAPQLQALDDGPGLEGIGFTPDQLDDMLAGLRAPDFQPSDPDDQPRLDRKFHLVCNNCGEPVDPATARKIDQ